MTVQDADDGDTTTSIETLIDAADRVETVQPDGDGIEEVVGDKGYHSNQSLVDLEAVRVSQLYLRTRSRTTQLEEQPRRPRCRVSQSSTHPWPARPTAAAAAR